MGIGNNIRALKAQVNLIQGVNIFITIINRTFGYHFDSAFGYSDYLEIVSYLSSESFNMVKFEKVVGKTECEICGEQTVKYNIDKLLMTLLVI